MGKKTDRLSLHRLSNCELEDLDLAPAYRLEHEDDDTKLYLQTGKTSPPHWLSYLASLITSPKEGIRNTSCSFVLLRRIGGVVYAATGGYGHTAIREHADDDFGIEVAIRLISEGAVASISQRAMKGSTRQVVRAVAGYEPSLDRENYNRILNALEGKARFEGRTFRVRGRSSLALRTARAVEDLDKLLVEIEDVLRQEPQVRFPRSYEEVEDEATVAWLDAQLVERFGSFWAGESARDDMYLEFSDATAQFRCESFEVRYDRRTVSLEEFDLGRVRDALAAAGARPPEAMEDLAKMRVSGLNEFGKEEFRNELFSKVLVYETALPDGPACIRLSGKWYRVLDDVQSFLDDELRQLDVMRDFLPAWHKSAHRTELDYNKFAAQQIGARCLDRDLVYLRNGTRVELCDIFEQSEKRFIHLKATWRSKAAYLFSQGLVSGELYRNSIEFRSVCRDKWPDIFPSDVSGGHIVFAIADNKSLEEGFPLNLSYFAKVSLYEASSTLRSLGFAVSLAAVEYNP